MSYFLISFLICMLVSQAQAQCPCSDVSLCEPLKIGPRKELFAFQINPDDWKYYDWNLVTTLANFGSYDPQMVCTAHSHNARLVYAGNFDVNQLYNQTAVQEWILYQYQRVVDTFADGVNVDIEDPVDEQDAPALTSLIANLSSYFHEKNPYYQITFDVAWSPNCIDKRCYDYEGLSKVTDFLVMMDYDMRSQIFGPCVASANSPPDLVVQGLANFTKLGISPDKLVLGLPCADGTTCSIEEVPFRGVNCSDAAGREKNYDIIMSLLQYNATTPSQWSDTLQSPWFNYKNSDTQQMHQVWYDNAESLKIKTSLAKEASLRGVSMWTGDFVDYQNDPQSATDFWDAMANFF